MSHTSPRLLGSPVKLITKDMTMAAKGTTGDEEEEEEEGGDVPRGRLVPANARQRFSAYSKKSALTTEGPCGFRSIATQSNQLNLRYWSSMAPTSRIVARCGPLTASPSLLPPLPLPLPLPFPPGKTHREGDRYFRRAGSAHSAHTNAPAPAPNIDAFWYLSRSSLRRRSAISRSRSAATPPPPLSRSDNSCCRRLLLVWYSPTTRRLSAVLANWVFFGVARGASAFPDFPDHEEEEEELEVDEAAAFGTGRRALAGRAPVELTRRGGAWRCCFFLRRFLATCIVCRLLACVSVKRRGFEKLISKTGSSLITE